MTNLERTITLSLLFSTLAPSTIGQTKQEVTPALLAELDTILPAALKTFDVPGAAVALIQNGQVIYAKGFGVRNMTTGQAFTADTVFRIGSTTKSMTAFLAATQVDRGLFHWDTPVRELYPSFRLPTEELTQRVTVRQLMGMGSGLGENPIELYADLYTPEYLLDSLPKLPVIAKPGTTFFYNNSIYAMGGYIGALKRGIEVPQLLRAYKNEMRRRIFAPIGMSTTAVTDDPSSVSDNYAVSYGYHLPDGIVPGYRLPFEPIRAMSPAGAVCTTLNDMARYLVTLMRNGIAPNDKRVVSTQNLTELWKPQTAMGKGVSYGMGWVIQTTPTSTVLNHGGSADGFRTDMTLLPDSGIAILIFANSDSGSVFNPTIRTYLYDKINHLPSTALETGAAAYQQQKQELQKLRSSVTSFHVESAIARPLAGSYEKGWKVEYKDDNRMLWLTRSSGYRLALLPTADGYLIGSGEEFGGFGMSVTFSTDANQGIKMTLTSKGQVIDSLMQLRSNPGGTGSKKITLQKVKAALPRLDAFVEETLAKTEVPGLAIGIVYKDEVVYTKGFGVREAGNSAPVDENTVFQLASMSKPIAATIVSALVTDGTVNWDDPVTKHDPEFQMYDPWVTKEVTIRDFFSHRSGLFGDAGNDIEGFGYRRPEIMSRLRYLKPGGDFRAHYSYSNFGLTEGALAAARATGKSWEQAATEKLYGPLRMGSTSSSYQDFLRRDNRAHLHIRADGKWAPKLFRDADAQSPAGGVSSNVRDLVQWVRLELGNGKFEGKQLINEEVLAQTHQPLMIRGTNPDTGGAAFYGLGWNVDYDERGKLRWSHAGAFSVGARTLVTLLPEDDLGIVVLTNAFPTGVPEGIAQTFIDILRYGNARQDWVTIWNQRNQALVDEILDTDSEYDTPPSHPSPALPSSAYTGTYRNDYLGIVEVSEQNGQLMLFLGPKRLSFPLEHWDRDMFLYHPAPEFPELRSSVTFTLGPDQTATEVVIENLNTDGQGTLTRVR